MEYKYVHFGKINTTKEKEMQQITVVINNHANQGWELDSLVMNTGWITGMFLKKSS